HDPPETLVDREIVDPSWSEPPKAAGDLFVGLRPVDDTALELTAVDASGTVLWTARRPLACTGFALADVGDRITVVLTDLEPGRDTAITTTATAYDLATGEELWGPVDVPGGHVGPGLVYSEVPTATMGTTGPRVALDPATGAVFADERDFDGSVVGEYDGIVLLEISGDLIARRSANAEELWRMPTTDLRPIGARDTAGTLTTPPPPAVASQDGTALVGDPSAGYGLVDV